MDYKNKGKEVNVMKKAEFRVIRYQTEDVIATSAPEWDHIVYSHAYTLEDRGTGWIFAYFEADGLYHQKYDFPPETILSHTFYRRKPEEFFRFYRDKLIIKGVKPNKAHLKLAELEKAGKIKAVVTQNIDGLHQAAGSKEVLELHGSTLRNYCESCGKSFDIDYIACSEGVPKCDKCGGSIKPDVVLYEEGLDSNVMSKSLNYIANADVLIIGGRGLFFQRPGICCEQCSSAEWKPYFKNICRSWRFRQ